MNLCELLIMLLIHEPMQVVMLQNHESVQVVNYVVNHNYMRSYHVIFPNCYAYAKIVLKTINLSFPLFYCYGKATL